MTNPARASDPKPLRTLALSLGTVAALWIPLIVLAHRPPSRAATLTDELFGPAVVASYLIVWVWPFILSPRRRDTLFRFLATTLTIVILILLLELPAVLRMVHWDALFRSLEAEGRDYTTAYVLDQDLSFRRIPELRWSGRPPSDIEGGHGLPRSLESPIQFTYDRRGYRNLVDMKTADVVLIGDSYVEGWYVSDTETVAARLGQTLRRPVANLGVAGYGTLQELIVLKKDAFPLEPRVVAWFFFEGNDLYDDESFESTVAPEFSWNPTTEETTPHPHGLARSHGWKQRSFVRNALKRLRRWSNTLLPNRVPYWAELSTTESDSGVVYFAPYGKFPYTQYEADRWDKAREALLGGIEAAREAGVHVLLLYIPTKYRVYRNHIVLPPGSPMETWSVWPLPDRFKEFCDSVGVPCLDLTPRLEEAVRQGGSPYAPTDTHWGPEGHSIVADELAKALDQLGWLGQPTPEISK